MADSNYSAFSYKSGNSFIHKLPSWIKILFIPIFNIAIFSLDWKVAFVFVGLQFALFFFLKFTFKEQIADLIPVIWYGVFLYLIGILSVFYENFQCADIFETWNWDSNFFSSLFKRFCDAIFCALKTSFSDYDTLSHVVKFFACTQSASLMFKTSTSIQLKEGIEVIEISVRRFLPVKKEPSLALVISMFINFIPAVFKIWNQQKRAWHARHGKNSLLMYMTLMPMLFSVGLKYALDTSKSYSVRLR